LLSSKVLTDNTILFSSFYIK